MFEDMFEVLSPDTDDKEKVIPVTYEASVVKAFLDLINLSKPVLLTNDFWVITKLRDMVRCHECEDYIDEFVEASWEQAFKNTPWEGLIYASDKNDVQLARGAMRNYQRYSIEQFATLKGAGSSSTAGFWSWMDRLRPEWQSHLIRLVIRRESYGNFTVQDDWSKLADKFNPPDPAGKRPREEEPATEAASTAAS